MKAEEFEDSHVEFENAEDILTEDMVSKKYTFTFCNLKIDCHDV